MTLDSNISALAVRVAEQFNNLPIEPAVTKRVYYNPGGQWNGSDMGSTASINACSLRLPVKVPVNTTRWRFVARNYDCANLTAQQALTGTTLVIGELLRSSTDGTRTGNFVGSTAATLVASSFTIPGDGTWYTSPWFTAPAEQLTADREHLLGLGYSRGSSGTVLNTVGECWRWTNTTSGPDPTVTSGSTATTGTPLDWGIEYECVTNRKHYLVIGDSIAEGVTGVQGTSSATRRNIPLFRAWPRVWAARTDMLVSMLAVNGFALNNYVNPTFQGLWDRFDWANMGLDGIIIAAGSNDLAGDRTLAQVQADTLTAIEKAQTAAGADLPVWLSTIIPRTWLANSAPRNTTKNSYNLWVQELPHAQARGVLDAAFAFQSTRTALDTLDPRYTCDNIHPSFQGLEALAAVAAGAIK